MAPPAPRQIPHIRSLSFDPHLLAYEFESLQTISVSASLSSLPISYRQTFCFNH